MKRFAVQFVFCWVPLSVGVFAILYKPRSELPAWIDDFCALYLFAVLLILPALQKRERRES